MGSKKERVTKVKGQIGELGPHVIKADHTAYDYIRIDVDGEIVMIRDVRVSQTIDSYLQPEMNVTLYVHGGDKQGNNGLVVGAEFDDRKITMDDDLDVMIEAVNKKMRMMYWMIGISLLPTPVLPLLLLFAVPVILLIMMVWALLFVQKRQLKKLRNEVTGYFDAMEQPV
jgi:hypothetical protein